MRVWEFEDTVWAKEGIRIVIRASARTEVQDYDYTNAATETWSLTLLEQWPQKVFMFSDGYTPARGP